MNNIEINIRKSDDDTDNLISKIDVFEVSLGLCVCIETSKKWCDLPSTNVKTDGDYVKSVRIEVQDMSGTQHVNVIHILPKVVDGCNKFGGKWFICRYEDKIEILIVDEAELERQSSTSNENILASDSDESYSGGFVVTQSDKDHEGRYFEKMISSKINVEFTARQLLNYTDIDSDDSELMDFYQSQIQAVYDASMGLAAVDEDSFLKWARRVLDKGPEVSVYE